MSKTPVRLIAWVCIAHILTMTGFSAFATLLADFSKIWNLSNAEAGTISSALFAGYTAAVPVLVTMTDRADPRKVYLISALISAAGLAGFALFARDVWSASLFHALFGAGLGGTYMPGLKALGDHLEPRTMSRANGYYTGCFSIGAALSYLYADWVFHASGWPSVFWIAAVGSVLGGVIVFFAVPAGHHARTPTPFSSMLQVFTNRSTLAWSICYGIHSWELFAFRAWTVAFLLFVGASATGSAFYLLMAPVTVAAIATLTGMPASILGNELCIRYGRRLTVTSFMIGAAAMALATGGTVYLAYPLAVLAVLIYSVAIMGDSAALTSAAFANAARELRGATMAVHSTIGFAGAALGPFVFGLALDFGGSQSEFGWLVAYIHLAFLSILAPMILKMMRPDSVPGDRDRGIL